MKNLITALAAGGGFAALIAGARAAIKSYRAKKSIGNIVADAAEAVIDEVAPDKKN